MIQTSSSGDTPDNALRSLTGILDAVEKLAKQEECVTVEDVIHALGRASSAALIFLPALIATTPLSGIPGLSAFCGIIIALIAGQAVLGRSKLWLPDFVMRRAVEGDKLFNGLEKVRKPLVFLDKHTHRRLSFLTTGVGAKLLFVLCMIGGMLMPFLELIPFSASTVAGCISLLTVAILTLDGALVLAAGCVVLTVAGVVTYLL
jgi:hypothetical protein